MKQTEKRERERVDAKYGNSIVSVDIVHSEILLLRSHLFENGGQKGWMGGQLSQEEVGERNEERRENKAHESRDIQWTVSRKGTYVTMDER